MPELNPYLHAKRDAQRFLKHAIDCVVDYRKTYATTALLYTLSGTGAAGVAAALNFPIFAFVAVAGAFVALCIHAIHTTNTIKKQGCRSPVDVRRREARRAAQP